MLGARRQEIEKEIEKEFLKKGKEISKEKLKKLDMELEEIMEKELDFSKKRYIKVDNTGKEYEICEVSGYEDKDEVKEITLDLTIGQLNRINEMFNIFYKEGKELIDVLAKTIEEREDVKKKGFRFDCTSKKGKEEDFVELKEMKKSTVGMGMKKPIDDFGTEIPIIEMEMKKSIADFKMKNPTVGMGMKTSTVKMEMGSFTKGQLESKKKEEIKEKFNVKKGGDDLLLRRKKSGEITENDEVTIRNVIIRHYCDGIIHFSSKEDLKKAVDFINSIPSKNQEKEIGKIIKNTELDKDRAEKVKKTKINVNSLLNLGTSKSLLGFY